MKILLISLTIVSIVMLSLAGPSLAGWAIWQNDNKHCAIFEDGKPKSPEFSKQVESTQASYKDALNRLQQLLKEKVCGTKG